MRKTFRRSPSRRYVLPTETKAFCSAPRPAELSYLARIVVSQGMIGRGCRRACQLLVAVAGLAMAGSPVRADECPRRFDQLTTGLPDACVFVGRYSSCGDEAVALFAGDGTALVVSLSSPATAAPLFIPAQALSATEGKVVLWKPDLELKQAPAVGSVSLEDNGRRLVVRLKSALPTASGCAVQEFIGQFAGMATADGPAGAQPQPIAAVTR